MNYKAILHIQDSQFCYALDEKTVELRLRTDKDDLFDSVAVVYGSKYDYYLKQNRAELRKNYTDACYNWYTVKLSLSDVRLVYVFELAFNGNIYYYSADGLTKTYDYSLAYYNSFQLPYVNAVDLQKPVEWMKNSVFYEIFVDRFLRGSVETANYVNMKWGGVPDPKSFAGGDIYGITQKLEYLKDLGINAVYLTPIFKSVSNHKYDVYDYFDVDEQFGGKSAFKEFVEKAHSFGIRVVLDAVFNHCSENTPQFQDVIKNGDKSPYFDWFIIRGNRVERGNFEHFGVCDYMPKWNTSNKKVREYLISVGLYWIREFKIDGWRLDVADEVSHDFWRHFRESIKAENPECLILGENWHDSYPFLNGGQFDGIMNYALTKAILDYLVNGIFTAKTFSEKLSELYMRNTDIVNSQMLNLLDSHDTHRFYTLCGKNIDKLICGLAIIYLHPGAPCIFYGTEIPLEGGYDPDCRRTMEWDKKGALNEILKNLADLRKKGNSSVSFSYKNELFIMERRSNDTIRLTVNATNREKAYKAEGKLLLQHNLYGEVLKTGFVVEEL